MASNADSSQKFFGLYLLKGTSAVNLYKLKETLKWGSTMKSSTEDKVEGKYHRAKGEIKDTVGELTGDRDLEEEGEAEKTEGKIQEKKGQIKKVFDK